MTRAFSPYFDPEFDSLSERINGPPCRVTFDNESLEDCTIVKIDCLHKQGQLLEVVQVLTEVNLTISKGYISSDAGWFMDVFHVKDENGKKVYDQRVMNYIQQAIGSNRAAASRIATQTSKLFGTDLHGGPTAIEMIATDRPGLFSEISAALADFHCNIVQAHAWSHNARLACVAYISDQSSDTCIDDHRLAAIEHHLNTILHASITQENTSSDSPQHKDVKSTGLIGARGSDGNMTTVERRLHQLLLSVHDFDLPPGSSLGVNSSLYQEAEKASVLIENCAEKGYSIVTVQCKDRRRLMFDTVCTLSDMQYVIPHASVDSHGGYAFQEYFVRKIEGGALSTESEKQHAMKCLEAAVERRVCERMSSLVERLRVRSDSKPLYSLDDSDDEADLLVGKSKNAEQFEKIMRDDAKEESCNACGESGNLLVCETCTYEYHPKCLLPPLKAPLHTNWRCPKCVNPLNDIEKILDCEMRPTFADDSDASKLGSKQIFVKQYIVKWKGLSYLHCTWVPEKEFIKAYKELPRLRTKVNNFCKQMSVGNNSEDDYVPIRPEYTMVDRILACREDNEEKEYLVKWVGLNYDECYWESESDISSFQQQIENFNRLQSRYRKLRRQKSNNRDANESKKKLKEFQQFEKSPEFLPGGELHPYQLEALNFLRFSWSKQTHVILADEMGLGKTIQSIAFLASLHEDNVSPHLVVAPLSTLRNWEREFATWAPHMNVVMYVGTASARAVIREYEFYFPKSHKKDKKKSSHGISESRQERIKFDVLLTSYEMINIDNGSLKAIKWETMIVDEGHRLKNKDSKLFSSLKQFNTRHRTLLTGTPLQNNLDELFMLMHFLDAGKFASLEEFQEEFKDINQEEQVSRLHKMLAPHLLRRVKKDVMKKLPPKKELILRVELSSKQKEYYKAILTRNYQILTRRGGAQISLINVVMELRKLCCHPFMLEGVEPEDTNEFYKQLLDSSGKLQLLDKMMVKLKEQGHRVLIYTQFQHMLDLLEDYCNHKKWLYERIDGKVSGGERQVRIDRFNASNSARFCFLLSTRAGGLGINLATADTVIIYDSDWNPHADLQAMARAHRLGQKNKVMIFRLVTRGTIEERMMEMTKKKMVLEHLVVGKLKNQNINQEELDDIIRYGSKELFADENDEAMKSRQIHYDDAAIDRLLNHDYSEEENAAMEDAEEDGFLKAFKVANFEYIDEVESRMEEEILEPLAENKSAANNPEGSSYWEELLKDRYEVHKVEEFNSMGKGKRSRKQMVSVEDDDLAGLEDVSSDADDNYELELSDGDNSAGIAPVRKPYRKKTRVDNAELLPLMEGEGRAFRVLGFNQSQRAQFVQILMRFGVGDFDWAEFTSRLKQKSYEEIKVYGTLFLSHISKVITDAETFSDGVPKEGLRIEDVLVRIAVLLLVRDKVKYSSENPSAPLFTDDIIYRYPGLRGLRFWKEEHDRTLLRAVLKHGYGRWQAIVDDKDSRVQEVVCQELNLPGINLTVPGVSQASFATPGGGLDSQTTAPGGSQPQDSATANNALYHFREMQRRLVEFVKKRVLLLEKGLNAEYQKEYFGDEKPNEIRSDDMETEQKVVDSRPSASYNETCSQLIGQLPQIEVISAEEISTAACDDKSDRLAMSRLYNEMCKIVEENAVDSVEAYLSHKSASLKLKKNLQPLKAVDESQQNPLPCDRDCGV